MVQACASLKVGQESPSHHRRSIAKTTVLEERCGSALPAVCAHGGLSEALLVGHESGLLLLVGANGLLQTIDVALHHILAI